MAGKKAKEVLELMRLAQRNWDAKENKPLPQADEKELERLYELMGRMDPGDGKPAPSPIKVKDYTQSEKLRQLIGQGADFQGIEVRNHGTVQNPVTVIREWCYVGKNSERKAIFVQYRWGHQGDAIVIEAGRTIAEAAYARFQK